MPSKSSGRIAKVRSTKNLTPHQKNHRWESFSTKISKFNSLQPLRKVRRHDLDTEDLSTATSYFQAGIQKWSELNISLGFSNFKREVLPLSESLPQLLHFEQRIMELLEKYISMQETEALEPLLDLLTAFAHDLGTRFEKYYSKSLDLVLAIAGRKQDVEVIEWTFGTLAFLFKYLSKLLVPDLRPTYDVMAPLLGKSRHPPHIARFAAEALSFLVRKAAAPSHRETSLAHFVRHVMKDLQSTTEDRQFTLYKDGLMSMFAEAIKGNDYYIHSAGPAVFAALVDAIPEDERSLATETIGTDLVCGVLTSTIHHATYETYGDFTEAVLDKITSSCEALDSSNAQWQLVPHVRFLGILAGVRRGERITNWSRLIGVLQKVLEKIARPTEDVPQEKHTVVWNHVIVNTAIIVHHAPIDTLIPHITGLIQSLKKEPLMRWFVPFCSYFCELDFRRFGSLFRTDFVKFVASQWSQGQNENMLCVLVPRMIQRLGFPPLGEKDCCKLPQAWQDQIVSKFERLEISPFPERGSYNQDPQVWRDRCLPKYSALLSLLEVAAVHPSTNARIAELLLRKLKLALRPLSSLASDEVHFIVSQGFHAYLRMSKAAGDVDRSLSPLLRAAVPRFARSVGFLHAYLAYEHALQQSDQDGRQDSSSSEGSDAEEDPVIRSLIENLSSPLHDIRAASLEILRQMNDTPGPVDCVDTMMEIEQTPLRIDQTRTIAMLLRRLALQYRSVDETTWVQQGVPSFVFGMLTVKMSPVWDDAVEALRQISQSKAGEESVCAIAFRWIEVPSARWTPAQPDPNSSTQNFVSDFECTTIINLDKLADGIRRAIDVPDELMLQDFDQKQQTADPLLANARSRALKVFNAVPALAEKRSRQLVPHFLSWASDDDDLLLSPDEEEVESKGASWSLADRKALLGVFSQFNNPRVLFQHEKVYEALLHLMENGDAEFQKSCLKAILAWKQEGVKPYQENLEYLLDDARFKNELTVFLQADNAIQPEHRPELMPVLLRLLYGRTISKKGAASGRNGLQATRLTVLRNLSVEDMGRFLDIATGKLKDVRVVGPSINRKKLFDEPIINARKQVGFLNMISSLVSEMGTKITPYLETVLNAVLYCVIYSCRHAQDTANQTENALTEEGKASTTSLLKLSRSTGIKCLIALLQNAQDFQWAAYHDIIIEEIVAPRIDSLPKETTQGVSGMLQLLSTWSVLPRVALFLAPRGDALPNGALPPIVACISVEKTKDNVKIYAMEIICNLVKLALAPATESEYNEVIKEELLVPNVGAILANITTVLDSSATSTELLEACVETILSLAPIIQEPENVQAVIRISTFLLQQPPRRVNPKAKGRVLLIVEGFVNLANTVRDEVMLNEVYETLSSLFSYFKDRENRQALSRALLVVSGDDGDLTVTAKLCADLNSFKEGRIDEPDYDKRLSAYNAISLNRDAPLSAKQWLPILHNLIFFIRVDEEFGILSSNSADGIRRFVQDVAKCEETSRKSACEGYLSSILIPAFYAGAREQSDTVRREHLRVLGYLLPVMPEWPPVADLKGLLNERQEDSAEPTFFFNILSPATARQLEALRTLESANLSHEMGSQNLGQFFIPLLEHFIFGRADGTDDHGLGAQATNTIGNLAMSLHWKHYRTTMQRYIGYVGSRPELQKQTVRLLGTFADALTPAIQSATEESMEIDQVDDASSTAVKRLSLTAPRDSQLTSDIMEFFLPPLMKYLHEKDESEVSYRVPVGVIIVKLLKLMPSEQMNTKLAAVLTDICHILRSKSWEAREMARDTLVNIAVILGPSFFGFILKELRSALTKGYQLHVLSYTMHSMLVAAVPGFAPGDLNYCLNFIVTVLMDDIFGKIGQEKDAEGYTSTMKEITSSKSQDSMELIAKNASITHLIDLVKPLRALLMQKLDLKIVRKIDALMSRIASGLLQNPAAESRDTLVFCYEVIQEYYNSQKPEAVQKLDPRLRKYLVQRGAKKSGERGKNMKHTYKLVRFAIDIMRSVLKKHDDLRNAENIAGFLPILGDAILEGEDEVKISAFRLLAVIVKVPFTNEDGTNIYKVAVKEATKSISTATSTTTELAQAALKMLAVVLRDRKDVAVKDAAIDMLLGKLKDDLTEPLYRHVTFNFLRSVLDRRIETATVYDTMDYVGMVMITNDDKETRDLARGGFFQFIREYPQKKARWGKQLNFIVANLQYEREGGRLSVMEIVHLLLTKSSDDFVQEVAATCFLPLFFVLANDESEKCRRSAAELMKAIFAKSDKERTQGFLTLLRGWLDNADNLAVQKLALQVAGYYFESHEQASKNKKDLKLVLTKVESVLATDDIYAVDGELVETTLEVVRVLATTFPERVLSAESRMLWANVGRFMRHPDTPAKLAAVRLVSLYLSDFAKRGANKSAGEAVEGTHGLILGIDEVQELVRLALVVLTRNQVDENVATEVCQVLIFLGPRLPVAPVANDEQEADEDVDEEEDDNVEGKEKRKSLQYLFWRLSHVLRREIAPRAMAINAKTAAMEVLETICRRTSNERLQPSFKTILLPLHNLTDPNIPVPFSNDELFKTRHENLKTRAQILMDSLQKKFGTAEYSKQLLAIRDEVKARRQQRTSKRKIEAIAQPEKYGRDKRKKFEREKERRKERTKEQKTARQAYKTW